MEGRGAGDHRVAMVVHLHLPALVAAGDVDRVDVGEGVAEVDQRLARAGVRPDRGSGADAAVGLEDPVDAAAVGVEGVDEPVAAADEDAPADDARLRAGGRDAGEAERPLERQPRHVVDVQAGRVGRLEACVPQPGAPAVPRRTGERIASDRRRAVGALGDDLERIAVGAGGPSRDVLGDRAPFGRGERRTLAAHGERAECDLDVLGSALPEHLARREARHGALVAAGAVLPVDELAVRGCFLGGRCRSERAEKRGGDRHDENRTHESSWLLSLTRVLPERAPGPGVPLKSEPGLRWAPASRRCRRPSLHRLDAQQGRRAAVRVVGEEGAAGQHVE